MTRQMLKGITPMHEKVTLTVVGAMALALALFSMTGLDEEDDDVKS